MAVAFHGFSIREYASKMRSVDVLKCWPFGGICDFDDINKEKQVAEELLPPITVTKFRWWSHELQCLRSDADDRGISSIGSESAKSDGGGERERSEISCPICSDFKAAAVPVPREEITRQLMRKVKSKARKKRSITEIFEEAPQIENVDNDVIGEVEEEGNKSKRNTHKKRSKKKIEKIMKSIGSKLELDTSTITKSGKKKWLKKKKKTKNRKDLFNNNGLNIAKKGNGPKLKLKTQANHFGKLKDSFSNKKFAVDVIGAHQKKKSSLKFSIEKREKNQTSISILKPEKPNFSIRGILKSHQKHDAGACLSDLQLQPSDRRVRFSVKDDILGPKTDRIPVEENMSNVFTDTLTTSEKDIGVLSRSDKEGSNKNNKRAADDMERDGSDGDIFRSVDKGNEVQPVTEFASISDTHEFSYRLKDFQPQMNEERLKHLAENSVPLSQVSLHDNNQSKVIDKCNAATLHFPPYAGIFKPLSALLEGHNSSINSRAGTTISQANTRSIRQPQSCGSGQYWPLDLSPSSVSSSYTDNTCDHSLVHQPRSHLVSTENRNNVSSFSDGKRGTIAFRTTCMDQNFFGLPLNSHGELVKFSTSNNCAFKHLEESCAVAGSSSGLSANNLVSLGGRDQLSMRDGNFVEKAVPKHWVNAVPYYPARLGVTEPQCSDRADVRWPNSERGWKGPCSSELNLMHNSFIEYNQHDQVHNEDWNGTANLEENSNFISQNSNQPTMRLMGKDVAVGSCSKEVLQIVDEKVFADDESRKMHYSRDATHHNSLGKRCSKQDVMLNSSLQISNGSVPWLIDFQRNQASQSKLEMNVSDPKFPHMYLDWQTKEYPQNSNHGVNRNPGSYLHPFTHASTSTAVSSGLLRTPDLSIPGVQPLRPSSQLQVLSPCYGTGQHMFLSPNEVNEGRTIPVVTKSTFEFPFLHPVCEEHVKPPWFQRPSRSLPPWLLNAAETEYQPLTSQQTSGGGQRFLHNIWGSNFLTTSSFQQPTVLHPPNQLNSHLNVNSPLRPLSTMQTQVIPVIPGNEPTLTINTGTSSKGTERVHSSIIATKEHHCNKTRKRPAAMLDDSTRLSKIPNLEMQREESFMRELSHRSLSGELQLKTSTIEHCPNSANITSQTCFHNRNVNIRHRTCMANDFPDTEGIAKLDAVKIAAGTKHILRPCENKHQKSLPIAAAMDSCMDLEIQKRSMKIYRF